MGNLSFSGTGLQHSSLHLGNLGHTDMDTHTSKSTMTSKLPPSGSTVYLVWGSVSQSSATPLLSFANSTFGFCDFFYWCCGHTYSSAIMISYARHSNGFGVWSASYTTDLKRGSDWRGALKKIMDPKMSLKLAKVKQLTDAWERHTNTKHTPFIFPTDPKAYKYVAMSGG